MNEQQRRHQAIDHQALLARLEINRMARNARLYIYDLCRFHTRSIVQVRRFEAAKLKQGDLK